MAPKVLITGLNGFVAVHTAVEFLKKGWKVRGIVRSPRRDSTLAIPAFKDFVQSGQLEAVIVDSLEEGDFTEALTGVDAVVHLSAVVTITVDSWAGYRDPAVKGTLNLLTQIEKFPQIKAVSVMSSQVSVIPFYEPVESLSGRTFTEADWAGMTSQDAEKLDPAHPMAPVIWYCVAKKEAEIAANNWYETVKPHLALSILTPPIVLGPTIHLAPRATPETVLKSTYSVTLLWAALAGGRDAKPGPDAFIHYIDVRTLATALYEAIHRQSVGRFNVIDGTYDNQLLSRITSKVRPDLLAAGVVPAVNPEGLTLSQRVTDFVYDGSKADKEFELQHIYTLEQTVKDTIAEFDTIGVFEALDASRRSAVEV